MDQGRNNIRDSQPVVGDLPQWNSRFSFSSQRQQAQPSSSTEGGPRRTPGLGQPRRVPLAAKPGAAGAADNRQAPAAAGGGRQPAGKAACGTPAEPTKTPTLCLFERFESLSLNSTPATTAAAAAGGSKHNNSSSAAALARPAPADSGDSNASADSSTGAADSSAQSGWQQQRRRPARHSVAFGTPSVLTYTPTAAGSTPPGAGAPSASAEGGGETPLWSNAGHTPYSLPGSHHGSSHAGGIRELPDGADSDDDDSDSADTAAAPGGMQLLKSVIHELPAAEAEHTPLAAVRCPRSPSAGGEAAGGLLTPASLHGSKRTGVGAAAGSSAAARARAAADISPPSSGSSFSGFRGAAAAVGGGGTTPAAATPAGSVSSGSITPTLFGQSKRRTSGGSSGMRMAREPAGSAAAAASNSGSPASASSGGGAGGSFLGTAVSAGGAVGGSTSGATSGGWAATPLLGMRLPPVTPKTKLRQPERVATAAKAHTVVPHELRQLLGGSSADMAPGQGVLGSCATLSPVRARRTVQQALDAGEQVLTPVRRSARKHPSTAGAGRFATPGRPAAAAAVQPMLEATNFCYNPNDAMQ